MQPTFRELLYWTASPLPSLTLLFKLETAVAHTLASVQRFGCLAFPLVGIVEPTLLIEWLLNRCRCRATEGIGVGIHLQKIVTNLR
eukprot:c17319_g2_i1 orf=379-636(+)